MINKKIEEGLVQRAKQKKEPPVALTTEEKIELLEARVEQLTAILRDFATSMFNLSICTPGRTEFDEDLWGELEAMHYDLQDLPKLK